MSQLVVIGSGASGVHFAWQALQQGHHVTMIDVGTAPTSAILPTAKLDELKSQLADPARYFLGERWQGLLLPNHRREYYGIPPSKDYIFEDPTRGIINTRGFSPLLSFAQGGLAQAWTAGCYPFDDDDLAAFPWGYDEIGPHYDNVASEIGISGQVDDTARHFPVHAHLLEPTPLDDHGQYLYDRYLRRRATFQRTGVVLGRSRVATLGVERGGRAPCSQCGRCLWGCPTQSLYTPSLTLDLCRRHPNFDYQPGLIAEYARLDGRDQISSVVTRRVSDQSPVEFSGDTYVLTAGTISSARIFLETLWRNRQERVHLRGLMDNRQVLMPFVTLAMIGKPIRTDRYQYHQLMMALETTSADRLVHCQITTLKGAAAHPIIQSIPLGLRAAWQAFREIRAGLGIANVNLADSRRDDNYVTLVPGTTCAESQLAVHYEPPPNEARELSKVLRRVRRSLWSLGAIAPSPMTHVRPMGASVHYAGTLPMSSTPQSLTTDPQGRSHDIANLYLADGSTFNALPAKNLTFTLMANARRIACTAFGHDAATKTKGQSSTSARQMAPPTYSAVPEA